MHFLPEVDVPAAASRLQLVADMGLGYFVSV